jgi:tartrate-resistant acid phosphatase type 5
MRKWICLQWCFLFSTLILWVACGQGGQNPAPNAENPPEVGTNVPTPPAPATPPVSSVGKQTILIFGDSGTGSSSQTKVAKAMYETCKAAGCNFAVMLGDNVYGSGVSSVNDSQFQSKFEKPYSMFGRFDFWVVIGNHDADGDEISQVKYSSQSQRWRMPALHYMVPNTPDWLHIYGLNTNKIDATQITDMKSKMCGQTGWKFLTGHHPIHSYGDHGDTGGAMSSLVRPAMKECGIQVYLAGHDHHQEHITGNGFEQIIQGAAAKLRGVKTVAYKAGATRKQNFAKSTLGFAIAEVTPTKLQMKFYDADKKVIYTWTSTLQTVGQLPSVPKEAVAGL